MDNSWLIVTVLRDSNCGLLGFRMNTASTGPAGAHKMTMLAKRLDDWYTCRSIDACTGYTIEWRLGICLPALYVITRRLENDTARTPIWINRQSYEMRLGRICGKP